MSTARLSPADRGVLVDEPWLEAFLEDGDTGLDDARARYHRAIAAARAEIRAGGLTLFSADAHRRRPRNHRIADSSDEIDAMTGQFVKVEPGGTVFRGLAVPFDSPAYLVEADGRLVAERFDEASITRLPENIPLLVGHRRDEPPAGVITSSGISKFGLAIEGRLVGSDVEVEGWRRKFADGLMASLSIGFAARGAQDWRAPERVGAPPIVIRRGVEIVEISLVTMAGLRQRRRRVGESAHRSQR